MTTMNVYYYKSPPQNIDSVPDIFKAIVAAGGTYIQKGGEHTKLMMEGATDKKKLSETHMIVWTETIDLSDDQEEVLEEQFARFNNDDVNPLSGAVDPEKQKFIRENRLHTSLSVGDVITFTSLTGNVEVWACKPFGWEQI